MVSSSKRIYNQTHREKVEAVFFSPDSPKATIEGIVPSVFFPKGTSQNPRYLGRENNNGNGSFVKVLDDFQFPGKSLALDGGSIGILLAGTENLNHVNGNTFGIRLKLNRYNNFPRIFNGVNDSFIIRTSGTEIQLRNQGSENITFNFLAIPLDQWITIVLLADGRLANNSYRCFLNGVESPSGTMGFATATTETTFLRIGRNNGFTTIGIDGDVDWVGFWETQLSTLEISNLSESNFPVTDCKWFLTLEGDDDEGITDVHDIVNNHDHTLENSVFPGVWKNDATIDYSHLNEKGYNISGSTYSPASVAQPDEDITGTSLQFKGTAAIKAQLKGVSNAKLLNGVDQSIRVPFEPSAISINGVDDTANWMISDIGGGFWTLTPNASKIIYNLRIDDKSYPCSETDGVDLAQYPINTYPATILNATLPDILTSVTDFHQHAYYGYWLYEDVSNNPIHYPSDIGASVVVEAVTYNKIGFVSGYIHTGKFNWSSDLYIPNVPRVHSSLRGRTFTKAQFEAELLINDYLAFTSGGEILLLSIPLTDFEKRQL